MHTSSLASPPVIESEVIREEFAEVNGCRTRYLTGGQGIPLIFIHGLMGYSFSWRFNLDALARHAQVYALDLPGTGFSCRNPAVPGDLGALARHVVAFMQGIGLKSAILLGNSHGGGVALLAAAMAKESNISIAAMILVAPINPWSSQGAFLTRIAGSALGAKIFRSMAWCAEPLHGKIVERLYGDPRRVTPETVAGYSRALAVPGSMEALLARTRSWKNDLAKIEQALAEVHDIPTLLLWGERDGAVYLSSARQLMKRLQHAELHVIPTAGHLPFEELPEEFNQLVVEFLERVS
jgi:pimeloyl-ACP methyl ester carboxylesterase